MRHCNTSFLLIILAHAAYGEDRNVTAMDYDTQQDRFVEFIDDDGVTHVIDTKAKLYYDMSSVELNNKYLLYTRNNPNTEQFLIDGDSNSIKKSNFNPNLITVVVVHGWLSGPYASLNPVIKDAFLKKSDMNIIIVDWQSIAKLNYIVAVKEVPEVGQALGRFLAYLSSVTSTTLSQMHLVGHSLGAHVVGNAGRILDGQVARITGLDPAGPWWYLNTNRMKSTDALYVEAIHTNGLGLGLMSHCADADFYPNGGCVQPGCDSGTCNHVRSWQYFAASIPYDLFIGRKCTSDYEMIMDSCSGPQLNMGNGDLHKSKAGVYKLNTRSKYPYYENI